MTDDHNGAERTFRDTERWLRDRIEALETEAAENARIIGMSAEREMALRGEVERLRKLAKDNNWLARMYKAQADEFRQKYVAATSHE